MESRFCSIKGWMLVVILFSLAAPLQAQPTTDSKVELEKGLKLLYRDVEPARNFEQLIQNASLFKAKFDTLVNSVAMPKVTFKKINGWTRELEFDSLVQRENHPANKVRGFLYEPMIPKHDDVKFPATLIIHHIADDIRPEQIVASMTAATRDSVTMVIYLPHFGVRKGAEQYLTDVPQDFELNILQSLTDIHQAGQILKASPLSDPHRIQLLGFSLGGVLTLMSAGLDHFFDRYLTIVGGGDMAHLLAYPKEKDPQSEISMALKNINADESQGREYMSRFDAISWAYAVHGKSIVMLNAESDELIDRKLSVDKLLMAYRENGNDVDSIIYKGTHRPQFNMMTIWELTRKLLPSLRKFMTDPISAEKLKTLDEMRH